MPSGVWAHEEYEKLRHYDNGTARQPAAMFQCHQTDLDHRLRRVCAGWAGCHDADHLLALRIALIEDRITPATHDAIKDYVAPVPLFATGADAADHGQADVLAPGPAARDLISKIQRTRTDLVPEVTTTSPGR